MVKQRLRNTVTSLFTATISLVLVVTAIPAQSLSGSQFNAGNIISDAAFFDGGSMNSAEIQAFLNSKVPVCDTNGDQAYSGTTRRAYSISRGINPPFTCLKDYRWDIPARGAESGLCNAISGAANISSADVIARVGQACGINPRVLLVLLQKEQSLVTDDWPWPVQYRSATGYGCPDTAACDSTYYGFFNQVYMASRQFKRYARDPHLYNYRAGQTSYILYNPNASCGGSSVTIANQATAGLYNYTPYQPNPSALANLYGTGDSCGAYGNRNFWRLWNDWFSNYTPFPQTPITDYLTRIYNPNKVKHLFFARESEVGFANTYMGYQTEGQAFRVMADNSTGGSPIHSMYAPKTGDYLLTAENLDMVWAIIHGGYIDEGIKFYAYTSLQPGTVPVYRLFNIGRIDRYYTTSTGDRDWLINIGDYHNNGIVFYVPAP